MLQSDWLVLDTTDLNTERVLQNLVMINEKLKWVITIYVIHLSQNNAKIQKPSDHATLSKVFNENKSQGASFGDYLSFCRVCLSKCSILKLLKVKTALPDGFEILSFFLHAYIKLIIMI